MKMLPVHKLSKASQFSLVAIVILLGGVFFTVNNALQQQNNASHASTTSCYWFGSYSYCPTYPTPTPYSQQICKQVWSGWTYTVQCYTPTTMPPTPVPTETPAPTQTSSQSVTGFVLWNASNKTQLSAMTNGMTINLSTLPTCINISAQTSPQTVGSVKLGYDSNSSFENADSTPYWLEDSDATNTPTCFNFALGQHTVTAIPYTQSGASGTAGKSLSITFTVVNTQSNPTPTCAPPPTCYRSGVLICLIPAGGWCGFTPTAVPTAIPTPLPTRIPTAVPSAIPTDVPQPTDTPVPGSTVLALNVGLHGIGNGGDSASPGSQGNMNPLRPDRTVTADVYDSQNQLVVSQEGRITYEGNSGRFNGMIDLGTNFQSGSYTVKIKTDQYLRALVPGIQTITAGQTNTLPDVTLIAGDINGDNAINIVDYNILIGCYSDLLPATDCSDTNNVLADLTDDGHVNQFDYNLFLRELTNIGGE